MRNNLCLVAVLNRAADVHLSSWDEVAELVAGRGGGVPQGTRPSRVLRKPGAPTRGLTPPTVVVGSEINFGAYTYERTQSHEQKDWC